MADDCGGRSVPPATTVEGTLTFALHVAAFGGTSSSSALEFFLLKRSKTQRYETYQLSLINTAKQGLNAVFSLTR